MPTSPIADMTNEAILVELCQNSQRLGAANATKAILGKSPDWGDCREQVIYGACYREVASRVPTTVPRRGLDLILDVLCRAFVNMTDVEAACVRFDQDAACHHEPRQIWEEYLRTAEVLMKKPP